MNELRVTIDPCNPGQFYACCGLIELFELAGAETLSHFELNWRRPRIAEFVVKSSSSIVMADAVQAIREATYTPMERPERGEPTKDAIAPISAHICGRDRVLDWWLDEFHEDAEAWKCWAGQVTTAKLFSTLPLLLAPEACFDSAVFASTRFGIDARSSWVALDLGYSANEQGQESRTFPLVEMLAVFGLQGNRPYGSRSSGFEYSLWQVPLPAPVSRAAGAKPWSGLPANRFAYEIEKRGSYKYFAFAHESPNRS